MTISVTPVNGAPVAAPRCLCDRRGYATHCGGTSVLGNDGDVDGGALEAPPSSRIRPRHALVQQ
ncbi:MAG: hypothetical protein H6643_15810 [Caldilineaceae bacterium]|nr:hypothetical protein [Caldilineaceae bacterium]